MAQTSWTPEQLVTLHENLSQKFTEDELRTLCFNLQKLYTDLKDLSYDSLSGEGKAGKARELVTYVEHRDCIPALVEQCRKLRPKVDWGVTPETSPASPLPQELPVTPQPLPSQGCIERIGSGVVMVQKLPLQAKVVVSVLLVICLIGLLIRFAVPQAVPLVAALFNPKPTATATLTPTHSPTPTSTAKSTPTNTPAPTSTPAATPTPTPLVTATVRLDALAAPEGWMSGGITVTNYTSVTGCMGRHTGSGCLQWTYRLGGKWNSVLWWPPGCGFDKLRTCGINVLARGGLGAVRRLTFWARGDRGGEKIEFKVGGGGALPESVSSQIVTLELGWRQYEIDLTGVDLTNASGLFLWTAADGDNPTGAVFYLDDILFEGYKR